MRCLFVCSFVPGLGFIVIYNDAWITLPVWSSGRTHFAWQSCSLPSQVIQFGFAKAEETVAAAQVKRYNTCFRRIPSCTTDSN